MPTVTDRPFRRYRPGFTGLTKEMQREQERAAFARRLEPLLQELRDAGLTANRELAEELIARGVASETGKLWTLQGVAAIRHRLAQMPVLPPLRQRRRTG